MLLLANVLIDPMTEFPVTGKPIECFLETIKSKYLDVDNPGRVDDGFIKRDERKLTIEVDSNLLHIT